MRVESPRPAIFRLGSPFGIVIGRGGGKPASDESLSSRYWFMFLSEDDEDEGVGGFFLASIKTYISPNSSAVLPPLLARVERTRPPILRPGSPFGMVIGIGGGRPASESSLSDYED